MRRALLLACLTLAVGCAVDNGPDPADPELNPQPLPPASEGGKQRESADTAGANGSSSSGGNAGGATSTNPSVEDGGAPNGTTTQDPRSCKFPGLC